MAKRKRKKPIKANKFLTYIVWGLTVFAICLGALIGGYYFGYESATEELVQKYKSEKKAQVKIKALPTKKDHSSVNKRLQEVLKKEAKVKKENIIISQKKKLPKEDISASHEYKYLQTSKPPKRIYRKMNKHSSKPKLAIIVDDVSTRSHVQAIKNLGIPITMSFLPPSKFRPNSAKLAAKEDFYMVHLPMEAISFNAQEVISLKVSDSGKKIAGIIKNIKKEFPKVEYINNHTGSKFTSNERAMNRLIYVLQDQKINFIDSRTIANTKVPKVMKNFGLNYVARDIFLDHAIDKATIKKQIKKAIKLAKLHGTAIAIGHPRKNTMQALKESKDLFNDIELVYIDRIY